MTGYFFFDRPELLIVNQTPHFLCSICSIYFLAIPRTRFLKLYILHHTCLKNKAPQREPYKSWD
jgi:hypothetical protein